MLQSINNHIEKLVQPIQPLYQTASKWYDNELVQKIAGIVQLVFGMYSTYQLYKAYSKHRVLEKNPSYKIQSPTSKYQKFIDIIPILGHLSYVVAALTSQPILTAWRWSVNQLLSADQMRILLKNSPLTMSRIYHIIQLSSLILGLPSMIYTSYRCGTWVVQRISKSTLQRCPPIHKM